MRRKMAYDAHLSGASHHLGQLPITVRSLTSADLDELEEAILDLKHDHRLVVATGLESLTERHRLPPAHVLGRLQRLAKSLRLPVICVVAPDYFSRVDADLCLQIDEARRADEQWVAQVQIVRSRHGGMGWVLHLHWDPHREILGGLGSAEVDDGGQRFRSE